MLCDVLDFYEPCIISGIIDELGLIQEFLVDLKNGAGNRGVDVGYCLYGFHICKSFAHHYFIAGFGEINEYQSAKLVLSKIGNTRMLLSRSNNCKKAFRIRVGRSKTPKSRAAQNNSAIIWSCRDKKRRSTSKKN